MKSPEHARERAIAPEAKLAVAAFAINFLWEMLQSPLFMVMVELPARESIRRCIQAAAGDAVILLIAFALVSLAKRQRQWILRPTGKELAAFVLLAAAQALALEWYSVLIRRWQYGPEMPVLPLLGIGVAPALQWLILPFVVVALLKARVFRPAK